MAENDMTLTEWRERIGERLMRAMTCLHADEDFGDGAVCHVCWENAQRIGAILEDEVATTSPASLRTHSPRTSTAPTGSAVSRDHR